MDKQIEVYRQTCDHCGMNKPCGELINLQVPGYRAFAVCADCADAVSNAVAIFLGHRHGGILNIVLEKSPLLKALDLIGPADNEEHFQARLRIAGLIVRGIIRKYDNKPIEVDRNKKADTHDIQAELSAALAGTEFTAQVKQPDNASNLVIDIEPKRLIQVGIDFANGPDWTVVRGLTYHHDCGECVPLGTFIDDDEMYDLYFCAKTIPTVIARYGNHGSAYVSGLGSKDPRLVEAERRARERKLL